MKRYARKTSRATRIAPSARQVANKTDRDLSRRPVPLKAGRDPAWFGNPILHARAAKKGIRRKAEAKQAASEKSIRGWLTRNQDEVARLQRKKRPTKKDRAQLSELRRKIRQQKEALSRKRPSPPRPAKIPPKAGQPKAVKKRALPSRKPKKLSRKEQDARARAKATRLRQEEAKRKEAALEAAIKKEAQLRRRRELAAARRAELLAKERAERVERLRREQLQREEEQRRIAEATLAAERAAAMAQELEELRVFRQTELDRRRRATINAAAILDELKRIYGGRIPPEGEMIGVAQQVDLTLREIYSIFYGSPEVFAA